MKLLVSFTLLVFCSFAHADDQLLLLDQAGQKGGAIEKLYSAAGRGDLAAQTKKTLKSEGDSVFFIIEVKDFSKAVIISNFLTVDGKMQGELAFAYRASNTPLLCQFDSMAKMTVYERANNCYFKQYQGTVYPSVDFESAEDFINQVKSFAEGYNVLKSRNQFIAEDSALSKSFKKIIYVFRTTKLYNFIQHSFLSREGWVPDLTVPAGWSKGSVTLSKDQIKVLAGIDKLQADQKVFLSVNAPCSKVDVQLPAVLSETSVYNCTPSTLMGETIEAFYQSMETAGYTYNTILSVWEK